jgi:ribonuclease HI
MKKVIIFSDGASRGNPGKGGWGAIIASPDTVIEIGGHEKKATNNRMELGAILGALKKTDTADYIEAYLDSAYVVNGISKWIYGWLKNNWKTKDGGDVSNKDLWKSLYELVEDRKLNWHLIKGHAGHGGNERVDEIATAFADGENIELYNGSRKEYKYSLSVDLEKNDLPREKDRKNIKAYSYLSLVNSDFRKHKTWTECESQIKGKSGAKFRKAISKEDEEKIMKEWGVI